MAKKTRNKTETERAAKKQLASDARGELARQFHASMKETEPKPTIGGGNNLSIACAGCNGKKVQYRKSDGINVLCPVCNGSGLMPSAGRSGGSAGGTFVPWNGYPWGGGGGTFPYPWDNGNLYPTKPYYPPTTVID